MTAPTDTMKDHTTMTETTMTETTATTTDAAEHAPDAHADGVAAEHATAGLWSVAQMRAGLGAAVLTGLFSVVSGGLRSGAEEAIARAVVLVVGLVVVALLAAPAGVYIARSGGLQAFFDRINTVPQVAKAMYVGLGLALVAAVVVYLPLSIAIFGRVTFDAPFAVFVPLILLIIPGMFSTAALADARARKAERINAF